MEGDEGAGLVSEGSEERPLRASKLAAKMLVIAWTLMKKKEVFDPDCMK